MKQLMGLSAVFAALLLFPAASRASEDADPFMFGGNTNYEAAADLPMEENDVPDLNEFAAPYQSYAPANSVDPLAPPPSDIVKIPEQAPQLPQMQRTEGNTVPKNQALTDTIKQQTSTAGDPNLSKVLPLPNVEGTWVDKLSSTNPLTLLQKEPSTAASVSSSPQGSSLESLVDNARSSVVAASKRSNASVFDISGVMLRMSLTQVDKVMQNRGFRKIYEKYQIPNFIKWRNEEGCRNSGVVGYERVEACVTERAKKAKHQYVQTTKYTKFDTKEDIEVTFTSNFTDNKVYKIVYKSMASNVTGNSPKALYLRNIKIYDFWKKINQKYGKPDDKENVTWGLGGNKPFLKAKTGWLQLEDVMLRELDYTRMSREDQRYMNTDMYSF